MKNSLLSTVRALILDMDGVLWHDDQPIGDLRFIFSEFQRRGYKVVLVTNNATRSAEFYRDKLARFGGTVETWQIVNSSQATAHYLQQLFPQGGPVFIIGESGLIQDLEERGFYPAVENVLAVVVGLDRQITYEKLRLGTLLIRKGALFIGTNPDRTLPTPQGLVPGAGAIIASLEASSGVTPKYIGKPAPEMFLLAFERLGVSPAEILVVGDRLETDIAGGQNLGCRTGLVLSGVTTRDEAMKWKPAPDIIAEDLLDLLEHL